MGLVFLNAPSAGEVVVEGATLTASTHATPYDGTRAGERDGGFDQYTPLWTGASYVYLGSPCSIASVEQSRAARISTAYVSQEDVQIQTGGLDATSWGHRGVSVCAADDGTVFVAPAEHGAPFDVRYTTSADDLSTLTACADPTSGAARADYDCFFRSPSGGIYWMGRVSPDGSNASMALWLCKWNASTTTWDVIQGPLTTTDGPYSYHLAWSPDGATMYLVVDWVIGGGTGLPRQNTGVVKSSDDGANWTTLAGGAVTIPFDNTGPTLVHSGEVYGSRIAVNSSGYPVVVTTFRDTSTSHRSLEVARWTGSGWFTSELEAPSGSHCVGQPSLTSYGDTIVLSATRKWNGDDAAWTGAAPSGTMEVPPIYIYVSRSGGAAWTRYLLDNGTWQEASLDPESLRVNGVVRALMGNNNDPTGSELWEFSVPASTR